MIARLVLVAFLTTTSTPLHAGDEFQDANNTTFDSSVVSLDNSIAGETSFSISTDRTTIGWQDLQQPAGNVLNFHFENVTDRSTVLNYIGAQHPSQLNGSVLSNGTVAFSNPFGIFIGNTAVVDVANLVVVAGDVSRDAFMAGGPLSIRLEGTVENHGLIRGDGIVALLGRTVLNTGEIAAGGDLLMLGGQQLWLPEWSALTDDFQISRAYFAALLSEGRVENSGTLRASNAALLGDRVVNFGEIVIDDGSLLMAGADAIYLTKFDDPVLIQIPNRGSGGSGTGSGSNGDIQYAVENHGRIDAGVGHVRLAASDPLGFAIRQGRGTAEAPASITAQRISLEGGPNGRVHVSGQLDASHRGDPGGDATGGEIDITGSIVVLEDALVEASGPAGGGTIRIGGDQQGQGNLQRARAVIIDEESEIHADALEDGDGGRVIVFAEDLTSVDGTISARGGIRGGDGGFVETSGLLRLALSTAPDVSAPGGRPGLWLIDPLDIEISNAAQDCPGDNNGCLNRAVEALLDPDFDEAGFDGILRTVVGDDEVPAPNVLSPDLLARALAAGTNITLSTQVFGADPGGEAGNIVVTDGFTISTDDVLAGTRATLTLLAANDIEINDRLEVVAGSDPDARFELSVVLRANDLAQTAPSGGQFDLDLTEGGVSIAADVSTGGGDFRAQGSFIELQTGRTIDTDGGNVDLRSGLIDRNGNPITLASPSGDPRLEDRVDPVGRAPDLTIDGLIDSRCSGSCTSDAVGGDITMIASSIGVSEGGGGSAPIDVITGRLLLGASGALQSGGGDIRLTAGSNAQGQTVPFAGSIDLQGSIASQGGDVAVVASRVDPDQTVGGARVRFIEPDPAAPVLRGEGGEITASGPITTEGGTLSFGGDLTRSVVLDGLFDTTVADDSDNGLFRVIARDLAGRDESAELFGNGAIAIGSRAATTIRSAGIKLEARNITTSDAAVPQAVALIAAGETDATFADEAEDAGRNVTEGTLDIEGERQIRLGENTLLVAETIDLRAAQNPTALSEDERASSETRLVFAGTNAPGAAAAQGVRLHAENVSIDVGDGVTSTADGLAAPTEREDEPGVPTDFGLARQTRADFAGLQLRGLDAAGGADATARPGSVSIRQDGALTIVPTNGGAAGELALTDAFGGNAIGPEGLDITLESSDGVLHLDDVAGIVDDVGPSRVTLNGGLLLPVLADDTVDADGNPLDQPIVFAASIPAAAIDAESLRLSSPGDFRVGSLLAAQLGSVGTLEIEAGRQTGVANAVRRGDLMIDAGVSLVARDRLSLRGGASGIGDLVFAGPGTTLAADEIELRAGQGTVADSAAQSTLSRIVGLHADPAGPDPQPVSIRDGAGNAFGGVGSTARAFVFRQDAGIAVGDLPSLDQFGLAPGMGFTTGPNRVAYALRSDQGSIVLDDGVAGTNEGELFRNADLSLIGLDSSGNPAIQVSSDFEFVGRHIELGGVRSFSFSQTLADAFNRTATNERERITLRAGLGQAGVLAFAPAAGQSVVRVVAPRIDLVAGDGVGGETGSRVDFSRAEFDLTGVPGVEQTFLLQQDSDIDGGSLPAPGQFVGGNAGLPDVLVLRTDADSLVFSNVDFASLPLDVTDDPGRLVLEGPSITLSRSDGADLDLTADPALANLKIRLRTNDLFLSALGEDVDGNGASVRAGTTAPAAGAQTDDAFDDERLLIEGFDDDAELATVGNLSRLSEDPDAAGLFDLAQGLGPRAITLEQEGDILAVDLPDRGSISGLLARAAPDPATSPDDDTPVPTNLTLIGLDASVEIAPEKVNGSALSIVGRAVARDQSAFFFLPGGGPDPGLFQLESLSAFTLDSIIVPDGTRIEANEEIRLAASSTDAQLPNVETTVFGRLIFEDGPGLTSLTANRITLNAGGTVPLSNPDSNRDGRRETIDDELLPSIDFSGLDALTRVGDLEGSSLSIRQNASLDLTEDSDLDGNPDFDLLQALASRTNSNAWENVDLASVQGDLVVDGLEVLAAVAENLTLRPGSETGGRGRAIVNIPNPTAVSAPFAAFAGLSPFTGFDDFGGTVEIQSNDLTFQTDDPDTSIHLASNHLRLVSDDFFADPDADDSPFALRDESNPTRPILRIRQVADFVDTQLPRLNQYFQAELDIDFQTFEILENVVQRDSLEGLDIQLQRTAPGGTLTFTDALRDRVISANLSLISAGDVAIDLASPTPGTAELDRAALPLASLEIRTGVDAADPDQPSGDGLIFFSLANFPAPESPFTGADAPPAIGTQGDQLFDGTVVLSSSLDTAGRDIRFTGDVRQSDPDAGLTVRTSGQTVFEGDLGGALPGEELAHLNILFDRDAPETAHVEFGRREDLDGDGFAESPVDSGGVQSVRIRDDIVFRVDSADARRTRSSLFATVGKAAGDLLLSSTNGRIFFGAAADASSPNGFIAGSGEKLSVGGTATLEALNGQVVLGDVAALSLAVTAPEIFLLRRSSGTFTDLAGETQPDAGPSISANTFVFEGPGGSPLVPEIVGRGKTPIFGVVDPFDPNLPTFLNGLNVFALKPNGRPLEASDFRFRSGGIVELGRVPVLPPRGPSRSDLSGAFGPVEVPTASLPVGEPNRLDDPGRLRELGVDPIDTPSSVMRARLRGAAVIDDLRLRDDSRLVRVSEARMDAADAEAAIALSEELFGPEGERSDEVRRILQEAIDQYLETTRARRVIGFELRRFVKNRPSTLFAAYQTLQSLERLFRYHRRLGLSPGEYRPIQAEWLRQIQPEGITVEELAETVHPSRYVRGSDILDIFGR
jgi:filamentous hemagglutinin family protein